MKCWQTISLSGKMVLRRAWVCLIGLFAILKLGAVSSMALSMLISLGLYALAFGLPFAIGLTILLFVHELGHLLAARAVGLRTVGLTFVPFIGAMISLKQPPSSAKMEANVAIGGPALGTLSALLCLAGYLWTESLLMLVLSYTACLLNLFNLIPCSPLDGGRVAAAISSNTWWLGCVVIGVVFFYTQNFFVLLVFLFSLLKLWKGDRPEAGAIYYRLTLSQRLHLAWWYFGLVVVLGVATLYVVDLLH